MSSPCLCFGRGPVLRPTTSVLYPLCRRSFNSTSIRSSGHNRWSKIKHEKGAADLKKNTRRSTFANNLFLYSKLYGPDPNLNTPLATVITAAKKAGMPKANIDIAIARGQGKSSSGAGLESLTIEVMAAPAVAIVIDVETDTRHRAFQELKSLIKKFHATMTPTAFQFTRKGRTVLKSTGGDFDEILMQALDAGAEDVEQDEDGNIILWTQPNMTHQAAQTLSNALSTEISSSDIIWSPTAEKVSLDDPEATVRLANFLAALKDYPGVQGVYANAERGAITEELWKTVEENLDS
ncbi:YebC-like protein [Whalleya microplaca]|nr:YebC-like protein [Whalleya microplaca]